MAVYRVPSVRALEGVSVKVVFVASAVMDPVTPGVTVKVVALIVAGFIGLLNVAEIRVLGQGAEAPAGRTEITVGGVRGEVGPPEFLSGSPQATIPTANSNAGIHTLKSLDLRISFPLHPVTGLRRLAAITVKFGTAIFYYWRRLAVCSILDTPNCV